MNLELLFWCALMAKFLGLCAAGWLCGGLIFRIAFPERGSGNWHVEGWKSEE